jgi:K+/H+ antiporter YhaU regulatory subunit KhtT
MTSSETNLPYVGTKVSISLADGNRVEVVIHRDGTRDVAFYGAAGEGNAEYLVRLDPTSACALGALLCASIQSPSTG